ncbi:hypothetical protein [Catellatospora citrea]|uniref:Uncharacterized protein n=1 Tax=Catellatospora citrea TaxID=53366 RepID=A0A8J3NZ56_9ACTN|nr:hypothetical protein [Catellatospora citrea]RKE10113.1 hypothetical protein C8E86_5007 [Catellatospora citrea]GIF97977.1 hypothetical protein Cci01nite_30710 [Catellatospora citrea]
MVREPDGVSIIDLGVLPADEPDEEPTGPAKPLRWGRRVAAVLAVAAVLTGVTAAGPLPRHQVSTLAVLPSATGVARVVDAGLVMVFENRRAVAYDPDGWRELWSVPGPAFAHAIAFEDLVVLFRGDAMNEPTGEKPDWAQAVDRTTGQLRWSSDRQVELYGDVMVSYLPGDVAQVVEFRDPRTAELRWRLPDSQTWTPDERRSALWRLTPDGTLVEHDLHTGAVRRTARVQLPESERSLNLTVSREAVGITAFGDGGWLRNTLWYRVADLTGISGAGQWAWEHDCGRGLSCAYTFDGGQVFLIDPATGVAVRSVLDGGGVGSPLGLILLGQDGEADFSLPTVRAVLDPWTGDSSAGLKGWRVLGVDEGLVRVLAHYDLPHKLTYLAELTDREAVRLGAVPHLLRECTPAGRTLVCATMAGDTVVLRIGEEHR